MKKRLKDKKYETRSYDYYDKKEALNIVDTFPRKCYYTNNSYWKTMKRKNEWEDV